MKLIVGLGNPTKKYEHTRHNIGFDIIYRLAEIHGVKFKSKFQSLVGEFNLNGTKVILLLPQTYMNLSGKAVSSAMKFYNLDENDIFVVFDDLDLNFNTIKLKSNSSSGGHNGIKDIINAISSKNFLRLKFGIRNEYKSDTKDFVLSTFTKEEKKQIPVLIDYCCTIIEDYIKLNDNIELQNKYN